MQPILHWLGVACILWAALVGIASVLVHTRVAWRATVMGRHLMAYMTVVALVLSLSTVRNLFGDSDWFALIRTVVFIGVPIVMTQRLVLQLRAQRQTQDSAP